MVFSDGVLRVYVCAAPVDGAANKSVVALVAKALRVPKSSVSVVKGETSRDKVLALSSLSQGELHSRLEALNSPD